MNTIIQNTKKTQAGETPEVSPKQFDDDSIITHDELERLLRGLLMDACYEPYAVYGLLFLFSSIKKVEHFEAEDICCWAIDFLYPNSYNAEVAAERLCANIHKAYRAADFSPDGRSEAIKLFIDAELESVSGKAVKETAEPETEQPKAAAKARLNEQQSQSFEETAIQIEMAMQDEKTPQGVKDCLYTIIFEASNEADMPLGDMSLVRAAFPNIIEALPDGYARGIYSSVQEILRLNTTAFDDFHNQKFDKEKAEEFNNGTIQELNTEDLALALSGILDNPNLPAEIYDGIKDSMNNLFNNLPSKEKNKVGDSPEYIAKLFELAEKDELENSEQVLDSPDSSIEDLAQKLSDIMHNPHLPDRIKGCLQDELHFSSVDFYTPENILSDLKDKLEVTK